MIEIVYKDVVLKPISVEDTDNIIKWRNSKAVRSYFLDQRLFTPESHLHWLNNVVLKNRAKQFIIWLTDSQMPVGTVYLKDIDLVNKKAEYGIFIGEESARGKGIGTKAAEAIINYGFNELGLHKIYLRVLAKNKTAIKSYVKAGFKQEAYFSDEVFLNGNYEDIVFMAIINTKEEYYK